MSEVEVRVPETREDRFIRRIAATSVGVITAVIVALLTVGAVQAQPTSSEETPSPAFSDQELQQIAEAFNNIPVEDEHFFEDDEHLRGGTLSFAEGAIQEPGDGSGGWHYFCQFRAGGGVPAEACEARIIYDPRYGGSTIDSLLIDEVAYSVL